MTLSNPPAGLRVCNRIKDKPTNEELALTGALVADGSGYFAALCVAEDFGCIRWEPKP